MYFGQKTRGLSPETFAPGFVSTGLEESGVDPLPD
jgi:hypothetical protein